MLEIHVALNTHFKLKWPTENLGYIKPMLAIQTSYMINFSEHKITWPTFFVCVWVLALILLKELIFHRFFVIVKLTGFYYCLSLWQSPSLIQKSKTAGYYKCLQSRNKRHISSLIDPRRSYVVECQRRGEARWHIG